MLFATIDLVAVVRAQGMNLGTGDTRCDTEVHESL
jgi:hypothetical protein